MISSAEIANVIHFYFMTTSRNIQRNRFSRAIPQSLRSVLSVTSIVPDGNGFRIPGRCSAFRLNSPPHLYQFP